MKNHIEWVSEGHDGYFDYIDKNIWWYPERRKYRVRVNSKWIGSYNTIDEAHDVIMDPVEKERNRKNFEEIENDDEYFNMDYIDKGVLWHKTGRLWQVFDGRKYMGSYHTIDDAHDIAINL